MPVSHPDYYEPKANWSLIPEHMHDGIIRWVMRGEPQGGFLMAVLANDFMEAASRADQANGESLKGWAMFLYNYTPRNSWGSPEMVEAWAERGGVLGHE